MIIKLDDEDAAILWLKKKYNRKIKTASIIRGSPSVVKTNNFPIVYVHARRLHSIGPSFFFVRGNILWKNIDIRLMICTACFYVFFLQKFQTYDVSKNSQNLDTVLFGFSVTFLEIPLNIYGTLFLE